MTEITPNQDALSKVSSPLKQKGGTAASGAQASNFEQILTDRLGEPLFDTAEETEPSPGLPELSAAYGAVLSQAAVDVTDFTGGISTALDQMDAYAQCLADPGKTLRQAYEILEEIQSGIQDLDARAENGSDTQIREILNHLSTLVAVEMVKLDRGDYT